MELPNVDEVQLPHFLGLRPGVYILTLLILAIGIAVFVLCFLPGILKGGRYVTFTSPLTQTGVSIDGTYLGGTPYQFFVQSGEHEVTFTKGGVEVQKTTLKVDHPLFLTWLVHRTAKLEADITGLSKESKLAIHRFNLQEVIAYSSITTFDVVHPYPPVFTNFAQDALAMDLDEKTLGDSFALATNFITSQAMFEDALQAKEMLAITTPLIEKTLQVANDLFKDATTAGVGLQGQALTTKGRQTKLQAGDFIQSGLSYPSLTFVMGSTTPSIFPETNKAGVTVTTEPFSLATTPVSQYQWALFIEENPQWDKTQVANLQSAELTDSFYLSGILPSVVFATGKPVTNISYKAAQAFCSWLTAKTGKTVFIPSQEMWTVGTKDASGKSYTRTLTITDEDLTSPSAMLGGVWEFTQTPYIPLQRLTDYQQVARLYAQCALTSDVIVKGGSYLNPPASITEHTVGAVDPTACGDLIGFRIAWKE